MVAIEEILKHVLGTCGDGHASFLFAIFNSEFGLVNWLHYIQNILKFKIK